MYFKVALFVFYDTKFLKMNGSHVKWIILFTPKKNHFIQLGKPYTPQYFFYYAVFLMNQKFEQTKD